MNENSGCAFQKSIFVGVQVSGVYLSTGDTVVNRKAYLWEFEYLVCIYLREQQWATNPKTPKANSEKKTGTVYLSLFSEKVVLCVCVCCVLCCVMCWVV